MMLITKINTPFTKTLTIPGSKSITNRALLLAALARGQSTLGGMLESDDTQTFAHALQQLGIEIAWDKKSQICKVTGNSGKFPTNNVTVNCQDAGTAARFLLAVCAQSPGEFKLIGSKRMEQRPQQPLIDILQQQGAAIKGNHFPLTVIGNNGLRGGNITVCGKQSSQFLSALLMIAPFAQTPMTINSHESVSQPYIDMTVNMMKEFGVMVEHNYTHHYCPVPQYYSARNYTIEPDCSTASYFFAAAAITNSCITIPHIKRHQCLQGDIQFLDVLSQMGCQITQHDNAITVQGTTVLKGINVNMQDFSDTFMTLACIAPFAETPVTITGIAHTRLQESDRVEAVVNNLRLANIKCESGNDNITIYPGLVRATTLQSYNDHRIAMAFALLGLRVEGISIDNPSCVSKTCPEYFKLLASLSSANNNDMR